MREQDWYPHLVGDVTPRPDREFPYVVVQLSSSLFECWPVRFVAPGGAWPDEDAVVMPHPHPDRPLSEHGRYVLVDEVRRRAARRQVPMSVVFSPTDAVTVSPDGRTERTTDPPRGGMQMVGVTPPR